MIFQRRQCRPTGARGSGLFLGDQRIAKLQTPEAAEVPIGRPQFAHAVQPTQSGHARIVDMRAGDSPVPHHRFDRLPVAFRLRQQRQARRFQPRIDLIDRSGQVGRRRVNSWMRDDGEEFVQAWPRNCPSSIAFRESAKLPRRNGMKRRVLAVRIDQDIGVNSDQDRLS